MYAWDCLSVSVLVWHLVEIRYKDAQKYVETRESPARVNYLWSPGCIWFEFSWENDQNNPLEHSEEAATSKCNGNNNNNHKEDNNCSTSSNNNDNDKHKNAITEMITWPMEAKRIRDDSVFSSAGPGNSRCWYLSMHVCMCVCMCICEVRHKIYINVY